MVAKRKDEQFLDVNATMQGDIMFKDPVNLRISGEFRGTLDAKGFLTIGKSAKVIGEIRGEEIEIAGLVEGPIEATRGLTLLSTAHFKGDVQTVSFAVEKGAIFEGSCKMLKENMSMDEISHYLEVESDKIEEWISTGTIPYYREAGKYWFRRREIDEWISSGANR